MVDEATEDVRRIYPAAATKNALQPELRRILSQIPQDQGMPVTASRRSLYAACRGVARHGLFRFQLAENSRHLHGGIHLLSASGFADGRRGRPGGEGHPTWCSRCPRCCHPPPWLPPAGASGLGAPSAHKLATWREAHHDLVLAIFATGGELPRSCNRTARCVRGL